MIHPILQLIGSHHDPFITKQIQFGQRGDTFIAHFLLMPLSALLAAT